MNQNSWKYFKKSREHFRQTVEELSSSIPELKNIQQKFADSRSETSYKVETPVVYNTALDDIKQHDEIKLILVADNPGRREQALENRKYLAGPSGKIAKKFFVDNPSLGIDFIRNVIILNKTPIHSPRTIELRELCRMEKDSYSGSSIPAALAESQNKMADILMEFHIALDCPVWITGYSEMKKNGIFEVYTKRIRDLYSGKKELYKNIFLFRHFSMNQFTIDLKQQSLPGESLIKNLNRIGTTYKKRILEI